MPRAATVSQADIFRVVRALIQAGTGPVMIRIEKGSIVITMNDNEKPQKPKTDKPIEL